MTSEIEKLERTMIALEAQRAILGDAVVETTLTSLREKLNALRSSTESLAAGSDDTQQRKIITVLFADIVGLTDWSDVEELRDAVGSLWGQLDSIIIQRGGRIDKHMGNGVMALWGAEQVSEDDPEQAIGAALALRTALNAFCEQSQLLTSEEAKKIKLRVGINTGPAIVGLVGMTGEFTALGDTVNLAARLNQAAQPGDILAGHDTYRLVRGVFDVEAQPPMLVKGKSEPVLTYIVLLAKPRAFRLQSQGVEGIETPLIARDAEVNEFRAAYIGMYERNEARSSSRSWGILGWGKVACFMNLSNGLMPAPKFGGSFRGALRHRRARLPIHFCANCSRFASKSMTTTRFPLFMKKWSAVSLNLCTTIPMQTRKPTSLVN